jgi:prepilin-type N-terminal cleavage/methylation domain-containing protein
MRRPGPKRRGFTLIEIAVVIGIIAILAAMVVMAINPARQFKQARNSQRTGNVTAILNALGQRLADNRGTFEGAVQGTAQTCPTIAAGPDLAIWNGGTGAAGALDLSCLVPTYLPSFPSDPQAANGADTGYVLHLADSGRITVKAPAAELGQSISLER